MSSLPVTQGSTFTCGLCNQSRTNWARYESRTSIYICSTCYPLVNQAGKIGANGGLVALGLNFASANGNSGPSQVGNGGGASQAPSGNQYNASPSANTTGAIFSTGSGNIVQQQIDPEQVKRDIIGG